MATSLCSEENIYTYILFYICCTRVKLDFRKRISFISILSLAANGHLRNILSLLSILLLLSH
jgi:hypothetical protein